MSPSGAQSLDPLGPFVGQQIMKPGNNNNNIINNIINNNNVNPYNEILKGVISVNNSNEEANIIECNQFHAMQNHNPFIVQHYVEGSEPLDHHHHHNQRWVAYPSVGGDVAVEKRRRVVSEELREKSIERKQKRMIKNRESAARSRARKQAYTKMLEEEVNNLKERNELLRNRLSEEALWLKDSEERIQQKRKLRRTSSAAF